MSPARRGWRAPVLAVALSLPVAACAQGSAAAPEPPPAYGAPVTSEAARRAVTAALAEARRNGWSVAVAVVDGGGVLVHFERIEGANNGAGDAAVAKARSAAAFRCPTKVFEDAVARGNATWLGLPGAVPMEGGIPVLVDGRVVGAIGVSGASPAQDGIAAKAGVAAMGGK